MTARLTLVVNPTAGRGRAQTLLPFVTNELIAALPDTRIDVVRSSDYGSARRELEAAVASAGPQDAVAVMGGDGILHLGINACAGTAVPLGMIPAGTGNDMCRGFGLPYSNPIHGAKVVAHGVARELDLLHVTPGAAGPAATPPAPVRPSEQWVGTVVASGFDALVNQRANTMTWPRGNLRYALAALAELAVFTPLPYRLEIDGRPEELEAMLIAVGNGAYFGGGMKICPGADPTDGLLDLTIVRPVNRATLLVLLPLMFSGKFVAHPAVEQRRARVVDIAVPIERGMGDGEPLTSGPLRVESRPRAVRVIGPAAPAE